jgi:hypothetical protein
MHQPSLLTAAALAAAMAIPALADDSLRPKSDWQIDIGPSGEPVEGDPAQNNDIKRNERLQRLHVPSVERRAPSTPGAIISPGVPPSPPPPVAPGQ